MGGVMSLLGLQAALGRMVMANDFRAHVAAEGAAALAPFEVGAADRDWLARLVHAPGFGFTCFIQRSWCELRARSAARLTMTALPAELRRDIVAAWLARGGGTASFFATETDALLDFVAARLPPESHLASICRMEQAAHRVSAAARDFIATHTSVEALPSGAELQRHPAASLVRFHAPPAAVLAAALSGTAWPALADDGHALVFAPGLPAMCRSATPAEVALLDACVAGTRPAAALVSGAAAAAALGELLRIGALVIAAG
jgi:hypothetical protein